MTTSTILYIVAGIVLRHFFPGLTGFLGKFGPAATPATGTDDLLRQLILTGRLNVTQGAAAAPLDGSTHTVPVTLNVQAAVQRPS